MKRILSLIIAVLMLLSVIPAMAETAEVATPEYLAEYVTPVVYTNEGGATVSTTLLPVLEIDGKYYKDIDNDGELDTFEDWTLDARTRAEALVSVLTNEQKAAFWFNNMVYNPTAKTMAEIAPEGVVDMTKVISESYAALVIAQDMRHGIYRGNTGYEAGVVALFNNVNNQLAEYAAIANGEAFLPFTLISNPISTGYVNNLALAAAVMGDVAAGGDYAMITEYATLDREMWVTQGIRQMYGPQIDISSDPRWPRNSGTYGEVPEVVAGITTALVTAYQDGAEGVNTNSVALSIKHFPGDGAAENGWESHGYIGQWRIYTTPGSLEKYQLVAFQAACDAGVGSIMPCYSRDTTDARSVEQTYRGVVIPADEVGSAYSQTMMQTLLTEAMGFKGFINTDSGILTGQTFGVEDLTVSQRYAKLYNVGVDAGAGSVNDVPLVLEAIENGDMTVEVLDACAADRLESFIAIGRLDNPYTDPATADAVFAANTAGDNAEAVYTSQLKSVVLLKNKGNALPLADTSKKVYIVSFNGEGGDENVVADLTAEFEAKGFTVVDDEDEADIAYFDVQPKYNVTTGGGTALGVIDLVEGLEMPERINKSQEIEPNGATVEVTTVEDIDKVAKIAEKVHSNGGIVVASIKVDQPWILTNLEPYCDGLIANFGIGFKPQIDVVTGAYNPTGKLPITMVSSNEVIAVEFKTLADGNEYEICVSPNDVPGYDKDQYIDPAILEKVPGGSYAYYDSEGNYYRAWFGLSY